MPRLQPAVKTGIQDTQDMEVGQAKPRLMKGTGDAKNALSPTVVEPVERPLDEEKVAMMAFMKEKITIRVEESASETEVKNIEVWNNGDLVIFPRGQEVTCERRFVETLMRAKPTKYTQKAVLDDLGKVGGYFEVPHTALRYPFQVIRDDNKMGADWLRAVLKEG